MRSETGNSQFEITETTTETKQDRLHQLVEQYVLIPSRVVWSDNRARFGVLIVLLYILMGTVGVALVRQPSANQGERLLAPFETMQFPLGTDNLGRGILAQIVHATPYMLEMVLAGAVFTVTVATVVGTLAGYKGGVVDSALMTVTDVMMTIPGLPLIIVLAVIIGPKSPYLVGIVLSINAWAGLARAIRSEVLALRYESYVEASRVLGLSTGTILRQDVIPNLMSYITMNFVQAARTVIFGSVGLYFLGILTTNAPNWGKMMNLAYRTAGALYTLDTAHWLLAPMLTIILLSLGLTLLAQGADRLFNPRIRARHADNAPDEDTGEVEDETTVGVESGGAL